MSFTEALHYEMTYWMREDDRRQSVGHGRLARIRLVPYEVTRDDDIV